MKLAPLPSLLALALGLVVSTRGQTTSLTHDAGGNRASQAAAVVNAAPTLVVPPRDQVSLAAGTARFSVVASGPGLLTYQWYKDAAAITDATNDTLVIAPVQPADFTPNPMGTPKYSVRVSNTFGTVASAGVGLYRDSVGQGLPDWWRLQYFGSLDAVNPLADADGDGISNLQEYLEGTAANNVSSHLGRLSLYGPVNQISAAPTRATYPEGTPVTATATSYGELQFGGWTGTYRSLSNPFTFNFGVGASFVADVDLFGLFGSLPLDENGGSPAFFYLSGAPAQVNGVATAPNGQSVVFGKFDRVTGGGRTGVARLSSYGLLDSAFNPTLNGSVNAALIQADGGILLAGDFTTVNGQARPGVARFLANGSLDDAFLPASQGTNVSQVAALAVQRDGKILLGGSVWDGAAFRSLLRLNPDGSRDASFAPTLEGGAPTALAVQANGRLLIGGTFTKINGADVPKVARLLVDGTLDPEFSIAAANGISGAPASLAVGPDGTIFVGGSLLLGPNGSTPVPVARLGFTGLLDTAFNARVAPALANVAFRSLALQDDGRIVGVGSFTLTKPSLVNAVRLNANGSIDPTGFAVSRPSAPVNAVAAAGDGSVLLGGAFTDVPPAAGPANNHVYLLTSGRMGWNAAEAEAVALGGHLVAVNSQAEQDYLVNMILPATGLTNRPVWIGFSDQGVEGSFTWSTGEPVTYTNWYPGEPNNFQGVEHYGALNFLRARDGLPASPAWVDTPEAGTVDLGGTTDGPYYGLIEIDPAVPRDTTVNWVAGRDLAAVERMGGTQEINSQNPVVPAWSYGYRATLASGALTFFAASEHSNSVEGIPLIEGWRGVNNVIVAAVTSRQPVSGGIGSTYPDELTLHPGVDKAYAVVRWTAPAAGTYYTAAVWQDTNWNGGDGASAHVVVNGTPVFEQLFGNTGGACTSRSLVLNAGDTVDFALGTRDGYDYDSTRFNAIVKRVAAGASGVWDGGRDLAANEKPDDAPNELLNPNPAALAWSYGWRGSLVSRDLNLYTAAGGNHLNNGANPLEGWGGNAGVFVNTDSAPWVENYGFGPNIAINPGEMFLYPQGSGGPYPVARWTAPATDFYDVFAFWQDSDFHGGNGFTGHITLNGGEVYGEEMNNAVGCSVARTFYLKAGDQLDFLMGDRGEFSFDATKFNAVILASNAGLTTPPASVVLTSVSTRAALAGNDLIDWASVGTVDADLGSAFNISSATGTSYRVTKAGGGTFQRHSQGGVWLGNFAPGDAVVNHINSDGPVTIAAASASGVFSAAGMQIQPNQDGAFVATITAYDVNGLELGRATFNGTSNANADNSAVFVGIRSNQQNIHAVSVDTNTTNYGGDFAVNKVSLAVGPQPPADLNLGRPRLGYARLVSTNHILPGLLSASPATTIQATNAPVALSLAPQATESPITLASLESSADGVNYQTVGYGSVSNAGLWSFPVNLPPGTTYYRAAVQDAARETMRSYAIGPFITPPAVTGPLVVSGDVGLPFSYRGTATGPLTAFTATGLPAWATAAYDANTGALTISGTPTASGGTTVSLRPANAAGVTPTALTINIFTNFALWRTQNFTAAELNNLAVSGPLGDATGAGISNLLKYALGIPAKRPGVAGLPTVALQNDGASKYLTLTYTRDKFAAGVTLAVEVSATPAGNAAWNSGSSFTTELSRTDNGNGTETVATRDNASMGNGNPQRFIRLRVSQ